MLIAALLSMLALASGNAADYDLPCLYADKETGGMLERADHCARAAGDSVEFQPQALERMDFEGDGLSPVFTNRSWHWVRPDGRAVAVVTFDNGADDFEDGLARGPWAGGMAYFDKQLNRVLATPYDWGDRFSGGLAAVCKGCRAMRTPDGEHSYLAGGEWGAIDRQGRLALPLRPDAASLQREIEARR
ncbi:WG repeat-containing protein [Achromobacter sp. NPDC058515]|uniref:WG repeat-containing protein n=1 Tax=Achromobacter sp. NPDC058515 TaxID=3346533 RepID=UPI003666612E